MTAQSVFRKRQGSVNRMNRKNLIATCLFLCLVMGCATDQALNGKADRTFETAADPVKKPVTHSQGSEAKPVAATKETHPLVVHRPDVMSDTALSQRAITTLTKALRNGNLEVRANAAQTLREVGDSRTVGPLIEALKDHTAVQIPAIEALGNIGDRRAIEPMLLVPTNSFLLRPVAVGEALARIGDARGVEALSAALTNSGSWVSIRVARALGRIGDAHATEALCQALQNGDESEYVQAAAIVEALGEIGNERAVEALLHALVIEGREDGFLGNRLGKALGETGDSRTVRPLLQALEHQSFRIRQSAAIALGGIGDSRAADSLIGALRDEYAVVRQAAAKALGQIGDRRAIEPLLATITYARPSVRVAAGEALAQLGNPQGVEMVIDVFRADMNQPEGLWLVQWEACEALSRIGGDRAIETLCEALHSGTEGKQGNIARALGETGNRQATKALMGILRHKNTRVRHLAAKALGRVIDPSALEVLIDALTDQGEFVRLYAAKALGKIGDNRAVEPLARVLIEDPRRHVQAEAANSLGHIGGSHAWSVLMTAPEISLHDDKGWRDVVPTALAIIALKTSTQPLREALNHPDGAVRARAAKALRIVSERQTELLLGITRADEKATAKQSVTAERDRRDVLAQLRTAGSRVRSNGAPDLVVLREGLCSSSIDEQFAAISRLAGEAKKMPTVLSDLKKLLAESESETVKLKVTGELAKLQDEEAVRGLERYVQSEDPVQRVYAAEIVSGAREEGVADELARALEDNEALVRVHAAGAILRTLRRGE